MVPGYNFVYDANNNMMLSSTASDATLNCPTYLGKPTGSNSAGTLALSTVAGFGSGNAVTGSYTASTVTLNNVAYATGLSCSPTFTRGLAAPGPQIGTLTATVNPGNNVCVGHGYNFLMDAAGNIGFASKDTTAADNCPAFFGTVTVTSSTAGTVAITASSDPTLAGTVSGAYSGRSVSATATTGTLSITGGYAYSIAGLAASAPVALTTTLSGMSSAQATQLVSGSGAAYTAAVAGIAAAAGVPATGVAVTFTTSGSGVAASASLTTSSSSAAALQTNVNAITPAALATSIASTGLTGVTAAAPAPTPTTQTPTPTPSGAAARIAAVGSALMAAATALAVL